MLFKGSTSKLLKYFCLFLLQKSEAESWVRKPTYIKQDLNGFKSFCSKICGNIKKKFLKSLKHICLGRDAALISENIKHSVSKILHFVYTGYTINWINYLFKNQCDNLDN